MLSVAPSAPPAEGEPYFPPAPAGLSPLLARYTTTIPPNVAAALIQAYSRPGQVVVDPFCRSSAVLDEAVRAGRRTVLADANPINAFITRTFLALPDPPTLSAALTRLSHSPKGETSLATHILSLYATTCSQCHQEVIAQVFFWSRAASQLTDKQFYCPQCRQIRLEPATEADRAKVAGFDTNRFPYWFVWERLSPLSPAAEILAQRLLALYTPRNLYALVTLILRIEDLFPDPTLQHPLKLLVLECLDLGNNLVRLAPNRSGALPEVTGEAEKPTAPVSLRPVVSPTNSDRRESGRLTPPAQPAELNVWHSLEAAAGRLLAWLTAGESQRRFRLTTAREVTLPGGPWGTLGPPVAVETQTAHQLGEGLPPNSVSLVLAVPPALRPGPWSYLSYLWSGWLLGRGAAQAFPLDRLLHPPDLDRYASALAGGLRSLSRALIPDGRVILTLTTGNLDWVGGVILGGSWAGLELTSISYSPAAVSSAAPALAGSPGTCYLHFHRPESPPSPPKIADPERLLSRTILNAALSILKQRGEPCRFHWLWLAALHTLARQGLLSLLIPAREPPRPAAAESARPAPSPPAGLLPPAMVRLNRLMNETFTRALKKDLVFLDEDNADEQAANPDSLAGRRGVWWLARPGGSEEPLTERLEQAIYNILSTSPLVSLSGITQVVYRTFPGLLTPEPGWIDLILASYAEPVSTAHWQLRDEDALEIRQRQRVLMIRLLVNLGHKFGYQVTLSREEQRRPLSAHETLGSLLSLSERYTNMGDLWDNKEKETNGTPDVAWFRGGLGVALFYVDWMTRLYRPVVTQAVSAPHIERFLVVPGARAGLIRARLERSSLLRQAYQRDRWQFLKFERLRELGQREDADEALLRRYAGLEAEVEQFGTQLTLL